MGYVKHKYTRAYFLKRDTEGNPTLYGAEGTEEFKKGEVRGHDLDILSRLDFKGKTVLDLGFGRGAMIKYAADMGAKKIVGVDFSEDAVEIASEFLRHYGVHAELHCDDALAFFKSYVSQNNSEPFDIVLMLDFIEHVPRIELSEMLSLLKKTLSSRAVIAINTPVFPVDNDCIRNGTDQRARDTSDDFEETAGMHCNRYTKRSLKSYMKGFNYIAISGHFFVPDFRSTWIGRGTKHSWRQAWKKGYPVQLRATSRPERFEYAYSWSDIHRHQNRPFIRMLRFTKGLIKPIYYKLLKMKKAICFRTTIKLLPKIARDMIYFDKWQKKGFHIVPIHFHQPIPDTRTLKDDIWNRSSQMIGIEMDPRKQLEFMKNIISDYSKELEFPREKTKIPHEFFRKNGAFMSVDAEVYHCMIRHFRPRTIIEVGSGSTTYLAARACWLNEEKEQKKTELLAIDPYPNHVIQNGFPGFSGLIKNKLQDMNLDFFSRLGENDIFFIDSTHVAQIDSDVNYAFLEIIPRLKDGVIVQVHDVFLPLEYPRKWIFEDRFFWSEQYVLQAFLCFNHAFEVLWGSSFIHTNHPDQLDKLFPAFHEMPKDYFYYPGIWPSSFWFRRRTD